MIDTALLAMMGDPVKGAVQQQANLPVKTSVDEKADLIDSLGFLVAGNYTSLSDDDAKGTFARLAGKYGRDKAQRLVNEAVLFNQNPSFKKMGAQQKVQKFFELGSKDQDVNTLLQGVKNFGSNQSAGGFFANNSHLLGNMVMTGRAEKTAATKELANLKIIKGMMKL